MDLKFHNYVYIIDRVWNSLSPFLPISISFVHVLPSHITVIIIIRLLSVIYDNYVIFLFEIFI